MLISTGVGAGALAGLIIALITAAVTGVARFPIGEPGGGTIAALVGVGAGLDAARLVLGRPGPPTLGRQVPSEWARIFPATVTAGLYGARLGVGPLTILSTWTWWSFTLAAALLGPVAAVLTGATFGLVKLSLVAATSQAAEESGDHSTLFGNLRAGQRPSWAAITLLSLALAVVASGCGSSDEATLEPADSANSATERSSSSTGETEQTTTTNPTPASMTDGSETETEDGSTTDLIEPAELEDVVRTDLSTESNTVTGTETGTEIDVETPPGAGVVTPVADQRPNLADDLLAAIDGYQPIDGPDADRSLDLRAAADIQPDPTEEISLLETRGFRGGWTRAFRNEHNDVAVASVYEFRDQAEAEFYLEDGLITIGGYGGTFFDIPDLPGVRGFAQEINSSDGEATEDLVSLGASFNRGDQWYLLYFLGSPERVTPEVLVPAIAAQLRNAEA